MKHIHRDWLRSAVFLLGLLLLVAAVTLLCRRKTDTGPWNYEAKRREFYALDANSLDYICVGSSHMYCTINPLSVWQQGGAAGFILATQRQPLDASCYYIREAMRTQSPALVVVEGHMVCAQDEPTSAVLHDAIDPLRPSAVKRSMIRALVPAGERLEYYIPLLAYHSRWTELDAQEVRTALSPTTDIYKGYVPLAGDFAGRNLVPDYENAPAAALDAADEAVLDRILAQIRSGGAQMLLLIAPFDGTDPTACALIRAEKEWAAANGVAVLDLAAMLNDLGVRPEDYYDANHLDTSGAEKTSAYFARWLSENGIEPRSRIDAEKWKNDDRIFRALFADELK